MRHALGVREWPGFLGLSDAELVSVLIETNDRHDLYSAFWMKGITQANTAKRVRDRLRPY